MNKFNSAQIVKDFKDIKVKGWLKVWEPFMSKYNCQYICELGVYKGENFARLIAHRPKLAVAVDSWKNDGVHTQKDSSYSKDELKSQYVNFKAQVKDLSFVQIIKDSTTNASKKFPDEFFDFVYVDADHSTEACYKDLISWYPKIKPGKFLVGHDYRHGFGVVDAVDRFIKENNLELIFMPPSNWAVIKK